MTKLTEVQRTGLIAVLIGISENDTLIQMCEDGGKQMAEHWLMASEDEKQELINDAKKGLEQLTTLAEQL